MIFKNLGDTAISANDIVREMNSRGYFTELTAPPATVSPFPPSYSQYPTITTPVPPTYSPGPGTPAYTTPVPPSFPPVASEVYLLSHAQVIQLALDQELASRNLEIYPSHVWYFGDQSFEKLALACQARANNLGLQKTPADTFSYNEVAIALRQRGYYPFSEFSLITGPGTPGYTSPVPPSFPPVPTPGYTSPVPPTYSPGPGTPGYTSPVPPGFPPVPTPGYTSPVPPTYSPGPGTPSYTIPVPPTYSEPPVTVTRKQVIQDAVTKTLNQYNLPAFPTANSSLSVGDFDFLSEAARITGNDTISRYSLGMEGLQKPEIDEEMNFRGFFAKGEQPEIPTPSYPPEYTELPSMPPGWTWEEEPEYTLPPYSEQPLTTPPIPPIQSEPALPPVPSEWPGTEEPRKDYGKFIIGGSALIFYLLRNYIK